MPLTEAGRKRVLMQYAADNGTVYNVLTNQATATANNVGGGDVGLTPSLPEGWEPRRLVVRNADGSVRKYIIWSVRSGNTWRELGGTIVYDGVTYEVTGRIGEYCSEQAEEALGPDIDPSAII